MKICVIGGRGGSGASTLAAALANTARRLGSTSLLIDADPLGGGLDLLLGAERMPGLRWGDLLAASGRVDGAALLAALPDPDGLPVLAMSRDGPFDVPVSAMRAVLSGASEVDFVVVDLPRHFEAAAAEAVETADAVVLLVPAEIRAVTGTRRLIDRIDDLRGGDGADLHVVVRRPGPAGLPPSEAAEALGLPLAGTLPVDAALARRSEQGEPPARKRRGGLADLCRDLLERFSQGRTPDSSASLIRIVSPEPITHLGADDQPLGEAPPKELP